MKKKLVLAALALCGFASAQSPLTFTVTNVSNSQSITCATPSVVLGAASNYTPGPVTFGWAGPSFISSGPSVTLTTAGIYTVIAVASNSANATQTISIGINTIAPTSSVSPLNQVIGCGPGVVATATGIAISPTTNITQSWYAPGAPVPVNSGGQFSVFNPPVGTSTYVLTNNINGCTTTKTVNVISNGGNYPTVNISSPQNFLLGCGSNTAVSISLSGQSGGGAITYTLLPPSYSGGPGYGTGLVSVYTATTPGTYTVIVRDQSNGCDLNVPLQVVQNTLSPSIMVSSIIGNTISCFTPSVILQASGTPSPLSYTWASGSLSTAVTNSSLLIGAPASPSSSITGIYTLTAKNPTTSCMAYTTITIYQNLYAPKAVIAGAAPISCSTPSINLTNNSSSNIPPGTFPVFLGIVGQLWQGPAPQSSLANSSTYQAYTPGVYTLTVIDLNNGCTSSTTTVVNDNRIYPVVQGNLSVCLDSLHTPVQLASTVVGSPMSQNTFSWASPANATVTGVNTGTLTTNSVGVYTLSVKSNSNSCEVSVQYTVTLCSSTGIKANALAGPELQVYPNPNNGVFNITLNNASQPVGVNIYNLLGVLVKHQTINAGQNEVRLENEPAGLYLLKTEKGGNMLRIIKQ